MSSTTPLQLLRSNTANKRPDPTALADGRPAINTNAVSPGLFFKDSAGNLVKVGPVHVGTTAPNASPASGGATGNSLGEQWLDTTGGVYVLKIWDGSAWRSETGTFVDASGDTMTGALVMDNQQQVRFREVTANGTNYIALQAPASVASDKTITLPDVNGTVVTTGDTGTVTSTMIADATIVDADISASAEIAVSKLADGTARQLLQTDAAGTGVEWTSNVDVPGTLDVTGAATFDSTVAVTGALTKSGSNVVTVGDTGTVTSTMILDGTIVNADVNASAAIAGTKISPDFGAQNVTTTGASTAASFIPTSSTVPANGVYLPAANSVAISTGGSGRLFVDASGNVGVGLSSPAATFGKAGSVDANGILVTRGAINAHQTNAGIFQYNGNETTIRSYGATAGTGAIVFNTGGGGGSADTERLRITSAGLVGVGTSAPNYQLHVTTDFAVGASGFNQQLSFTNDTIQSLVLGSGYTALKLNPLGGNVGVGTTSPGATLDVNGNIRISSAVGLEIASSSNSTITHKSGGSSTAYYTYLDASRNYIWQDNATERMRIDSSGRVGIGTSSPSGLFDVRGFSYLSGAQIRDSSHVAKGYVQGDARGFLLATDGSTNIAFDVNGTERMRLDSSGRLGIGTTSPAGFQSGVLHVHGSTGSELHLTSGGSGTAASDGLTIEYRDSDTTGGVFVRENGALRFGTNDQERARIDSSGRLLVGTSSARGYGDGNIPFVQVERATIGGDIANIGVCNNGDNGAGPKFTLAKSRSGSNGGVTVVQNGDSLGSIQWSGADGTDIESVAAQITCNVDGTPGTNDMPGRLVFSTTADGASSPTEAMRIDSTQNLLIGGLDTGGKVTITRSGTVLRLNTASTSNTAVQFVYNGSTQVGTITTTTTATAYNTSSDYRLKENVAPVTDGITRLQQLKPSRFNFIANPAQTVDGFIAHEVQAVVPEAITGTKDAVDADGNPKYQGIDQSKLVPLLTAALQEAIGEIESLKARVAALESA